MKKQKGYAVIGSLFGDEGKGITTDFLCKIVEGPKTVIRFSGGQQAGHCVHTKHGVNHIFSTFGSGTLRGVPTYLDDHCFIDPISMKIELDVLNSKGVFPTLYISDRCRVTTPMEVYRNSMDSINRSHGSCGRGIFATFQREKDNFSLLAGDLLFPSVAFTKFKSISENYYRYRFDPKDFMESINFITNHPDIHIGKFEPHKDTTCIYEGSQGLLLDQTHGIFPNVTPSNTGLTNIDQDLFSKFEVYLVTRAYQTRHGNGFMTNESIPSNIKPNPFETNDSNEFQGDFRRSIMDLDLLKYAYWRHGINIRDCNLVITNMDQIQGEFKFTYQGRLLEFPTETSFVLGIIDRIGSPKSIWLSHSPISDNFTRIL